MGLGGRWYGAPAYEAIGSRRLRKVLLPPDLLERVANYPNDEDAIEGFTKRYGPLSVCANSGGRFTFSFDDWRRHQATIREDWVGMSKAWTRFDLIRWEPIGVEPGEDFIFEDGELSFKANTLSRYLRFELQSIGTERVRLCARPQCVNPYFIAGHLGRRYCSQDCLDLVQKAKKLEWWNKTGDKVRRKRAAAKHKRSRHAMS